MFNNHNFDGKNTELTGITGNEVNKTNHHLQNLIQETQGESMVTANSPNFPESNSLEIVTVRPESETQTRQKLPYFVGISGATAGTTGLSMNLVSIPPNAKAEPHIHKDFETAIYILSGQVETRYGQGLKQSVINQAGDFLFIPPGVPHQPCNLSSTDVAQAIVARNDPNEQENVVLYDPSEDQ